MIDQEFLQALSVMMDSKLAPVYECLDKMDARMDKIETDIRDIKKDIRRIDLTIETEIMPQLREIQTLYVDTFERYKNSNEDIEDMKSDIRLLKVVVSGGRSA